MSARLASRAPDPLASIAPLVGEFAASGAVLAHLNRQLDALVHAEGAARARTIRHWQIVDLPAFTLTMFAQGVNREELARSLESWPGDRLIACAWPEATEIETYRCSVPASDVFDPSAHLTDRTRVRLRRGETHLVRARDAVVDLFPSDARGVVLDFALPPQGNVVWTFDAETLRARAAVAADKEAAKLEYLAWTLVELGDPASVPAIEEVFAHPAHFVRWTAVRTAMELDADRGAALLARAADDPHPHVRTAARRARDQLAAAERDADTTAEGDDGSHA